MKQLLPLCILGLFILTAAGDEAVAPGSDHEFNYFVVKVKGY